MEAASIATIRKELKTKSPAELQEIILNMARFKKESKELLTYLLFEAPDEMEYIRSVQEEMDAQFETVNRTSYFLAKKTIRKILRTTKKHIRFSKKPATEISLLLHFCRKMQEFRPSIHQNIVLSNLYDRQIELIRRKLPKLHEDLQWDFGKELEDIEGM